MLHGDGHHVRREKRDDPKWLGSVLRYRPEQAREAIQKISMSVTSESLQGEINQSQGIRV